MEAFQEGLQGHGSTGQGSGSTGSVLLHPLSSRDQTRQTEADLPDEFLASNLVSPAGLWDF